MIRRPPRSTLFPTRRSSDLDDECTSVMPREEPVEDRRARAADVEMAGGRRSEADADVSRSEEHTSELQSQSNLVCRLLLEKKKKQTPRPIPWPSPSRPRLSR